MLASLAAAVLLTMAALARYHAGGAFVLDFGFFRNALVSIAVGHWNSTVLDYPILADHMSLILYPLSLLYKLMPHAWLMLSLQGLGLALAAIPLYLLARTWAGSPVPAVCLAVAYLVAPWVWSADVFDFHPEALFPLLLFSALYFAALRRLLAATILLVLAIALKELIAVFVLGISVWWAVIHRKDRTQRTWGLWTAFGALAWAAVARYLETLLSPAHAAFLTTYFGAILGGHTNLLTGAGFAVTHPAATLAQLLVSEKWRTVGRVLMSSGFAALADPAGLIVLLPGIAITTAASHWPVAAGIYAEMLPFGAATMAASAGGLRAWQPMSRVGRTVALGVAVILIAIAAYSWTGPSLSELGARAGPSTSAATALLREVPRNAPLGVANDGIGALASGRTRLYLIPGGLTGTARSFYAVARQSDYLLYPTTTSIPTAILADPSLVAANLSAMGYARMGVRSGWVLWQRVRHGSAVNPETCAPVGRPALLRRSKIELGKVGIRATDLRFRSRVALRLRITGSGWLLLVAQQLGRAGLPQFASDVMWLSGRPRNVRVEMAAGIWQWAWVDPSRSTPTHVQAIVTVQKLACP